MVAKHGVSDAVAYKRIGSMLAEMFNLKEDTKKEIKAAKIKAAKIKADIESDAAIANGEKTGSNQSLGHYDPRLKRMQDRAKK